MAKDNTNKDSIEQLNIMDQLLNKISASSKENKGTEQERLNLLKSVNSVQTRINKATTEQTAEQRKISNIQKRISDLGRESLNIDISTNAGKKDLLESARQIGRLRMQESKLQNQMSI